MKKQLITSIVLIFSLSIQSQSWWNSTTIKGNGNIITKTRTIGKFEGIKSAGSFDINLIDGIENKIIITGEENIIPYIITEVNSGILKIKFKKNTNISTSKKLTITISFKEIESISLNGSGNITSKKVIKTENCNLNISGSGDVNVPVNTNSLTASIAGSGTIELKGTTEELNCTISGSGDINAYNLKANELKASLTGSGDISTTVINKIDVTIIGSGSIKYKGNPKNILSNIIGSGNLIEKN